MLIADYFSLCDDRKRFAASTTVEVANASLPAKDIMVRLAFATFPNSKYDPITAQGDEMTRNVEIGKSQGPPMCGSSQMTELFTLHETDCYEMYSRYCNEQLVQMLRIIGFDVGFCRGEGAQSTQEAKATRPAVAQ